MTDNLAVECNKNAYETQSLPGHVPLDSHHFRDLWRIGRGEARQDAAVACQGCLLHRQCLDIFFGSAWRDGYRSRAVSFTRVKFSPSFLNADIEAIADLYRDKGFSAFR